MTNVHTASALTLTLISRSVLHAIDGTKAPKPCVDARSHMRGETDDVSLRKLKVVRLQHKRREDRSRSRERVSRQPTTIETSNGMRRAMLRVRV